MARVKKLLYSIFRWWAMLIVDGQDEEAFVKDVFIYQVDSFFETYGLIPAIQAYYLWRHEWEREDR